MNILRNNTLAFYAPIVLFFPQLFLSFNAITKQEAVLVDWILLIVAITALLLSGIYVLKRNRNAPQFLGPLYIAVSIGSIIYAIVSSL